MSTATAPAFTAANVSKFVCPRCHSRLVTLDDEVPWCGGCAWNLDHFEPHPGYGPLLQRMRRWELRTAYDLGISLVEELRVQGVTKPKPTRVRYLLIGISVLLLAFVAGLAALGGWLLSQGPLALLGVLALVVAVAWRPRLGSRRQAVKDRWVIREHQAPHLFALIAKAAEAVNAPVPTTVVISWDWNASAGVYGVGRHRVLELGLPLWTVARPQERVALLGHEMGHFVNGDSHRSVLTQPALITFGRLATFTDFASGLGTGVIAPILWLLIVLPGRALAFLLRMIHLYINALAAGEQQRAEHYADALAARAGGTSGALGLADLMTDSVELRRVVAATAARGQLAPVWRTTVNAARERWNERLHLRRQLSLRREASIFASHPPAGLRHQLLSASPWRDPGVQLTEEESQQIDAELTRYERACAECIHALW